METDRARTADVKSPPGVADQGSDLHADVFFRTKLSSARGPDRPVERERLTHLLDDEKPKLFMVRAPAGFGKTTLLQQWQDRLASRSVAHAWLTIDRTDNDPTHFLGALETAIAAALPAVPTRTHGALGTGFIEKLQSFGERFVLLLDDIESLQSDNARAVARVLLTGTAASVQIVVAGRAIPSLGQARMRVSDAVVDVGPDALRFRPDETATFFSQRSGRSLTNIQLGNIQHRTDGWAAALQLARLSMRDAHTVRLPADFDQDIADYLDEVVLDGLPPSVREFLISTSILRLMTGSLCDELTGRTDGARVLADLEARGLFLKRIGSESEAVWYRCDALFNDVMRRRLVALDPGSIEALHEAAARWFATNGIVVEAAEHAKQAGQPERAYELLDGIAAEYIWSGRLGTVRDWGADLTIEQGLLYERLFASYLWAEGFAGDREKALRLLDEFAQACAKKTGVTDYLADVLLCLPVMLASADMDLTTIREKGPDALANMSSKLTFEYGTVACALAYTYAATGEFDLAHTTLADAKQASHASFQTYNLAYTKWMEGHLHLCELHPEKALAALRYGYERADARHRDYSQSAAISASLFAEVLYEMGDLVGARTMLERHLPMIVEILPDCVVTAYSTAAALHVEAGEFESAERILLDGEMLGLRRGSETITRSIQWQSAWLAALQGDARSATRTRDELAARESKLDQDVLSPTDAQIRDLYRLRIDIITGRLDGIIEQIDALYLKAQTRSLGRRLLRLGVLRAAALRAIGSREAGPQIIDALRTGLAHGFVQCFLDEGPGVAELIRLNRSAISEMPASSLVRLDHGLAAHAIAAAKQPHPRTGINQIADLTAREADVLAILEKGLTNREIAEALNLTENTIKWHLKHIFEKLGVGNRTEAVFMMRGAAGHPAGRDSVQPR